MLKLKSVKKRKLFEMIERLLELVQGNLIEVALIFVLGLLLGELISHIYWRIKIRKKDRIIKRKDTSINKLENSLEQKEYDMKELSAKVRDSFTKQNKELESQDTTVE